MAVLLRGRRGPFLNTKARHGRHRHDVLLETGVLIQPLPVWEEEWEHPENYTHPALLQNIHREGVRL